MISVVVNYLQFAHIFIGIRLAATTHNILIIFNLYIIPLKVGVIILFDGIHPARFESITAPSLNVGRHSWKKRPEIISIATRKCFTESESSEFGLEHFHSYPEPQNMGLGTKRKRTSAVEAVSTHNLKFLKSFVQKYIRSKGSPNK